VPTLTPDAEEVPFVAPSFVAACLSAASKTGTFKDWELGNSIVTKSKKWGIVHRTDFKIRSANLEPLVNRIMCWRKESNSTLQIIFAIGQRIPKLKTQE
jgi:hypothetical protein